MSDPERPPEVSTPIIDLTLRLAGLAGLLGFSLYILLPFLGAVIWGGVLAIALYPFFQRINGLLGNRPKTAAALLILTPILFLSTPIITLTHNLVTDVAELTEAYQAGNFSIIEPPEAVRDWPVIGKSVSRTWQAAHDDLPGTIKRLTPQLARLQGVLVGAARSTVTGLIKFLFSMIVMGVFLVAAKPVGQVVSLLARRIGGSQGGELLALARDTVRSVARGIVGVAAIQAMMGGLGCLAAGIPGAGIWTLLILVLAVAQLPVAAIMLPLTIYLFITGPLWIAVVFGIWTLLVSTIDNVLKPILLGQGVDAPLLVIFLGAIGGLLTSGVVGLFLGPVVLVLSYTLVKAWAETSPPGGSALSMEVQIVKEGSQTPASEPEE